MDEERSQAGGPSGFDLNGDGQLTVTDLLDGLVWLFFLPGDAALGLLMRYAPGIARFLELGDDAFGGTLSILISILAWLTVLLVMGTAINFIRNVDRKLTARIAEYYNEARRRLRVAKQLRRARKAAAGEAKT